MAADRHIAYPSGSEPASIRRGPPLQQQRSQSNGYGCKFLWGLHQRCSLSALGSGTITFLSFHVRTSHVCELYINNQTQKDKCEACTQTHMCEVDINNHAHKHTCEVCTRSYEACQSSHVFVCTYPTCTFDRRASPIRMTCTPERNVRTKFTYRPSSWRWTQWPGTPPSARSA